jgi:hypothetical protein
MTNHLQVRGDVLKNLGNVFAKHPQRAMTLPAAGAAIPMELQ